MKHWVLAYVIYGLLVSAWLTAFANAQNGDTTVDQKSETQRELRFFRVQVPLDHEEEWEKVYFGFEPHRFPIKQTEFERLIETIRSKPHQAGAVTTRVASLQARARLQGDALIGDAELEVISLAESRTQLSLVGCQVAIGSATWEDGRTADLGAAADGTPVLLVERSGKLRMQWSLRGTRDADAALRFALQLPRSEKTRIDLELPRTWDLTTSAGLLEELSHSDENLRQWRIDLGSLPQTQLIVRAQRPANVEQHPWLVNQQSRYVIDHNGLRLESQCVVNSVADSPTAGLLTLKVEAGLQLTSVKLDDTPHTWEAVGDADSQTIVVRLDAHALSPTATRTLSLSAIGEFPPGAARSLPAIRPLEVIWQSGREVVAVGSRWQIGALDVTGGRLSDIRTTTTTREATVDFFQPQGRATLRCEIPQSQPTVRSTYAWRLSPNEIEARLWAELTTTGDAVYDLSAALAPGWEIDTQDVRIVATTTSEATAATLLESRVRINDDQLHVQLATPLTSEMPLRLQVVARRQINVAQQPLLMDDLQFLRLPAQGASIGVAMAAAPMRVRLLGSNASLRVPRDAIGAQALAWLPTAASYTAFYIDQSTEQQAIEIVRDPPRIDADVDVTVDVDRQQLSEQYEIHIRPDGAGVDRLRIRFRPPRSAPLAWTITTAEEQPVMEFRRLDAGSLEESTVGSDGAGGGETEIWEVQFHEQQTSPFTLHALRAASAATAGPSRITLASVDEATTQTGRVVVCSPTNVPVEIMQRRLRSIAGPAERSSGLNVRGAYRYDPTRATAAGDANLQVAAKASVPQAWAWSFSLESQLSATGAQAHRATWLVQNEGAAAVRVLLPAGAVRQGATVAGRAVELHDDRHGGSLVPLPATPSLVEVSIDYSQTTSPWGVWHRVSPPLPTIDIPVLRQRWRAVLPPAYAASSAIHAGDRDAGHAVGQRLFGSLYQHAPRGQLASASLHSQHPLPPLSAANELQVKLLLEKISQADTSWGQAFVDLQLAPGDASATSAAVLIDVVAMFSLGLQPQQPIQPIAAETSMAELLARERLALVFANDTMIVTSREAARAFRSASQADESSIVVASPSDATALLDARYRGVELVTPQIWASPYSPKYSVEVEPTTRSTEENDARGQVVDLVLPAAGEATILVYQADWLEALRWPALLAALGLGWWAARWRMRTWIAAIALAGCAALWASPPWSELASGAFLGLLVAAAWRFVERGRPATANSSPVVDEASTTTAAVPLTLLLLAACALATLTPSAVAAETKPPPPFPVWIPVDGQGKPSGEVYLPKEFYDELQARAAEMAGAPQGWFLLGAAYDLRLNSQGSPAALKVEELRMTFQLEVLEDVSQVKLPLPRAGLAIDEAWATLDGQPIDIGWREGQAFLDVPIELPGKHVLELRVQPTVVQKLGNDTLDLAIPPVASAELQITAPLNAPPVRIEPSFGSIESHEALLPRTDGSEERVWRWHAALGGVDRLRVGWPPQAVPAAPAAEFNVERLLWLDLNDPLRLLAKFRCEITSGTLSEVVLTAPKELTLVASSARWEAIASPVESLAAYRLVLDHPADKSLFAQAEFKLRAAPGYGRMLAPRIELNSGRTSAKDLLALTLPADMVLGEAAPTPSNVVDAFVQRWGEAPKAPPTQIVALAANKSTELLLQPTTALPQARESLQVTIGKGEARVAFQAAIQPISPPLQQYALQLPPAFSVQNVAVELDEDEGQQVEWWSVEGNELRLFLRQPMRRPHRLNVAGQVDMPLGRAALPMLFLQNIACTTRKVELRRDASVLAEIAALEGFEPDNAENTSSAQVRGRRIALLNDSSPTTKTSRCTINISENRPSVGGRQITTLLRDGDAWRVRVDVKLDVADGVVDVLRWQLPAGLSSKFEVQPAVAYRLETGSDGVGRELVVMPNEAVGDGYELSFTTSCETPPGQNLQVPDIRLRDVPQLSRFVVAPRAIDGENIEWQVDRLLALSEERREALQLNAPHTIAYRVASDPFHAELRALRRLAGVPLVRLADVRLAWAGDFSCSGWATFDLEPAGLSYCTIAVPHNYRLAFARVGDVAAQVQPLSARRWRVALRPHGIPQRIEVFYQGELPATANANGLMLAAPLLEDIAVERTLWTVYAPRSVQPGVPQTGGLASALQQDLVRLRSLTELMRLPKHVRVETSGRELVDWFIPWEARWHAAKQGVVRGQLQAGGDPLHERLAGELAAIDADHEQILRDLNITLPPTTSRVSGDLPPFWQFTVSRGDIATRSVVQGSSAAIIVGFPQAAQTPLSRWIVGGLLGLLGAALLLSHRWLPTSDWPLRSSRAIGVLVGIAWALWLWPAWIGWIIVVLFLLPTHWPHWKRAPRDADSAIIVRSAM